MEIRDYWVTIGIAVLIVGLIFWRQILRSAEKKRLQKKGELLKGTATVLGAVKKESNRITGHIKKYRVWEFEVDIEVTSSTHPTFTTKMYADANKKEHNLGTLFAIGKKFDIEFEKNNLHNLFFDVDEINKLPH